MDGTLVSREPLVGKHMKLEFGLDAGLPIERLRTVTRIVLSLSLGTFFVSVVLMGANVGNPVRAEGVASLSSLAIALSGFAHIALGLSAARATPCSSSLAESQASNAAGPSIKVELVNPGT